MAQDVLPESPLEELEDPLQQANRLLDEGKEEEAWRCLLPILTDIQSSGEPLTPEIETTLERFTLADALKYGSKK